MNNSDKEFFSKDFTNFFINNIGGSVPPEKAEVFLAKLQYDLSKYHFSKSSETNLIRIISALFDKTSFVNDSVKYPHHLEIISAIVSSSNFLTDIIVQNPEFLYQAFSSEYLIRDFTREELDEEIKNNLNNFRSFESKLNFLRQFKKRIILKIGVCDILQFSSLEETTAQLTHLASSIISSLFNLCYTETMTKYSLQLSNDLYCVASLGKHGGNELNYSSDVDLIIFYEKDFIPSGPANKEYFELLNEAALLFIKSASDITPKGYIYRVDLRLRPDGKNSPLCRTITDYMRYYEARGENWERQMLIKLNYVCGGRELFNSFYGYLAGFIFPASQHNSMKEQVKKIKNEIERKAGSSENVKLFSGGIRDIEFSVQVLQLINGGMHKELRNGNTLQSIGLLYRNNLLTVEEADILREAYIFYRRTEHFLQLMNDLQTHLIPDDEELLDKLVNYHQLKNKSHFKNRIKGYREKVKNIFHQIVKSTPSPITDIFSVINFADKKRAVKNFNFLQNGSGLLLEKGFETDTIEKFRLIENDILKNLIKSPVPDKALENFAKVIKASHIQSLWYNQLQNRNFLKAFLTTCRQSQKSVELICSNRSAEDYFISGNCFYIPDNTEIRLLSSESLLLTLSVLLTLNKINEKRFSSLLSEYIDANITLLTEKFEFGFFIAALGSYGSSEMNFSSDIDFIMVVDDDTDINKAEMKYEELVKALNKNIPLFEVDLRLRPEGKNSQLIRQISSYRAYLKERARVWEFQAFSKLRFVCGDKKLFNSFTHSVFNRVTALNKDQIRKDIIEMHNSLTKTGMLANGTFIDLKKSKGGFATIEFATQYLLLSNISLYKKCIGKPVLFTLKYMACNCGNAKDFETLLVNYKLLKKLLLFIQNFTNNSGYKLPSDNEGLNKSLLRLKLTSDSIDKQIKAIMRENLTIFDKIAEK